MCDIREENNKKHVFAAWKIGFGLFCFSSMHFVKKNGTRDLTYGHGRYEEKTVYNNCAIRMEITTILILALSIHSIRVRLLKVFGSELWNMWLIERLDLFPLLVHLWIVTDRNNFHSEIPRFMTLFKVVVYCAVLDIGKKVTLDLSSYFI